MPLWWIHRLDSCGRKPAKNKTRSASTWEFIDYHARKTCTRRGRARCGQQGPAVLKQTRASGARFVEIDVKAEGSGGYARELTDEEKQQQVAVLAKHVAEADVALVIGANDVVNPSARSNPESPIYGMPILNADYADNVIVIKRGQGKGFSGVENALFFADNTRMLYGDGQAMVGELIHAVKDL